MVSSWTSMKLSSKIKIHSLTLIFMAVACMSGYFKYMLMVMVILFIHESGHIIAIKIFKRKISEIVVLPFGGLIKIDSVISSNIAEDLLIAIAGVGSEAIFGFILIFLHSKGVIDEATFSFMSRYNTTMILFNLLPICPLDGYRIVKCLLEFVIPFGKTFVWALMGSSLTLMCVILYDNKLFRDNPFVFIFLIYSIILELINCRFIVHRFYVERMNRDISYPIRKIKNEDEMYKNNLHLIKGQPEKVYLRRLFTSKMQ